MGRPVPLCAYCGKRLTGRQPVSVVVYQFHGVPGRPAIGWHWALCESADDEAGQQWRDDDGLTLAQVLRTIAKRGRGRVVAGKGFRGWLRKQP